MTWITAGCEAGATSAARTGIRTIRSANTATIAEIPSFIEDLLKSEDDVDGESVYKNIKPRVCRFELAPEAPVHDRRAIRVT
jgi:hypothetical protein